MTCTKCKQDKPESGFSSNPTKSNKKASWCIQCVTELTRAKAAEKKKDLDIYNGNF